MTVHVVSPSGSYTAEAVAGTHGATGKVEVTFMADADDGVIYAFPMSPEEVRALALEMIVVAAAL